MIKEIHIVKAGRGIDFGNQELVCIDSWRKVYPDFKIITWDDSYVREKMLDCKYAYEMYERGLVVFALDYVKLKILYERGGICMDTDVVALNRIPDKYFNKTTISWAAKFETNCTNSGTFMYTEPHNPLIQKFIEYYQGLETPTLESGKFFDNSCIDKVIEREYNYEFKIGKRGTGLEDLEFDDLIIANRVQFGVEDIGLGYVTYDGREQYFLHCHAGSWASYEKENCVLYYTTLDRDTDENSLYSFVDWFATFEPNPYINYFLVVFVNALDGRDRPYVTRLLSSLPRVVENSKKNWKFIPIGDNLPKEDVLDVIVDFTTKRFNQIKYIRDVTGLSRIDDLNLQGIKND